MRNLFLLLVLANLGFLAWSSWFAAAPAPRPPWEGPGITLLRELDQTALESRAAPTGGAGNGGAAAVRLADDLAPEAELTAAAAPAAATAGGADRCIAIGPFAAEDDAGQAMTTLEDAGFAPTLTTRQHDVRDGYWVYIEQIGSMERAREIDAELEANGLADAYPLAGSDRGILISLGVFSDISRAGLQAERVGRLGHEATIADNLRAENSYWLDLRFGAETSGALDLLQQPGRINRFEEIACEPGD